MDGRRDEDVIGEIRNNQGVQPVEDFGEIATKLAAELGRRLTEVHYNALARFERALPVSGSVYPARVADEKPHASQAAAFPPEGTTCITMHSSPRVPVSCGEPLHDEPSDLSPRRPVSPTHSQNSRSPSLAENNRNTREIVAGSTRNTLELEQATSNRCPGALQEDTCTTRDSRFSAASSKGRLSPSVASAAIHFEPRPTWIVEDKVPSMVQHGTRKASMEAGRKRSWAGVFLYSIAPGEIVLHKSNFGKYVLHPQGMYRLSWDILACVFLLYDFIVIPLEAFDPPETGFKQAMSMTILLYWTLDIAASLRTGIFIKGKLSFDSRCIAWQYFKTWFLFDCIVVLTEWLTLILNASMFGLNRLIKSVRILRMVRVLRIGRVEEMIDHLKDKINGTYITLCITMAKLILALCILLHFSACAWYALGRASRPRGWIYVAGISDDSLEDRYVFTFIWAMARLHPSAYNENLALEETGEMVFAIITSLLALCLGGFFISSVTNTMFQLKNFHDDQNRKLYTLRQYVRDNNITTKIGVRVHKYLEQSLRRRAREMRAAQLQDILPPELVADLHADAWSPVLSRNPFFDILIQHHNRVVWYLGKVGIKEETILSSDRVFFRGDPCTRMTFVAHGSLLYSHGKQASVLNSTFAEATDAHQGPATNLVQNRGMALSEPGLWTHWMHCGEAFGLEESTLLFISVEVFIQAMMENKDAHNVASDRAKAVLKWLNDPETHLSDVLPSMLANGRSSRGEDIPWARRFAPSRFSRGFDQIVPTDT